MRERGAACIQALAVGGRGRSVGPCSLLSLACASPFLPERCERSWTWPCSRKLDLSPMVGRDLGVSLWCL